MARSSTVPLAIPAIVAAFRGSPGLADVAIRDGPVVTASGRLGVVVVGWTGQEGDERAAEVTSSMADAGDASAQEQYSVRCAASVLCGSGDPAVAMATARGTVYGFLDACAAALAADRRLGGVAVHTRLGDHTLDYVADTEGLTALVEFMVDVQAFTGR